MVLTASIRANYIAQTQKKRLYGGILSLLFVALLIGGFVTADNRNAGGFWDGLDQVLDFPSEVLSEEWEKIGLMPGNVGSFLPSLMVTINIAAAATLLGALSAIFLSLLSRSGLERWPSFIPVFRRYMDIRRAVPESVIALV